MKVKFDDNIGTDTIECWGITVHLLKSILFGKTKEERKKRIKEIISEKLLEIIPKIEEKYGYIEEVHVSLASAWTRYYVFRLECFGENKNVFALNLLSPNSHLKSFKNFEETIKDILKKFPDNIAKPLYISDDIMLQEWVEGKLLSDFKDGDILIDEEEAKRCIPLTSSFLYELKKEGYVYTPWDDYEVVLRDNKIILLDLTRFVKRDLKEEEFFEFYYGVPFTPPEIIKPHPENPAHRLYWRGVSDKDYFGTDRKEYRRLFLLGVARECESFEEFKRVCGNVIKDAEKLWREAFRKFR
uniref:Uncharacterized protein n=1 Tax=Geoglobus ahangari TaxID=113653 RepID=A0A7C4WEC1_9EURY